MSLNGLTRTVFTELYVLLLIIIIQVLEPHDATGINRTYGDDKFWLFETSSLEGKRPRKLPWTRSMGCSSVSEDSGTIHDMIGQENKFIANQTYYVWKCYRKNSFSVIWKMKPCERSNQSTFASITQSPKNEIRFLRSNYIGPLLPILLLVNQTISDNIIHGLRLRVHPFTNQRFYLKMLSASSVNPSFRQEGLAMKTFSLSSQ